MGIWIIVKCRYRYVCIKPKDKKALKINPKYIIVANIYNNSVIL